MHQKTGGPEYRMIGAPTGQKADPLEEPTFESNFRTFSNLRPTYESNLRAFSNFRPTYESNLRAFSNFRPAYESYFQQLARLNVSYLQTPFW